MVYYRKDLRFGRESKDLLEKILAAMPTTIKVRRLSPHKTGLDMIWVQKDQERSVIVKTERKYLGSLFLETVSNHQTGKPGWFRTTAADVLIYGFRQLSEKDPQYSSWLAFDIKTVRQRLALLIKQKEALLEEASHLKGIVRAYKKMQARKIASTEWSETNKNQEQALPYEHNSMGTILRIQNHDRALRAGAFLAMSLQGKEVNIIEDGEAYSIKLQ